MCKLFLSYGQTKNIIHGLAAKRFMALTFLSGLVKMDIELYILFNLQYRPNLLFYKTCYLTVVVFLSVMFLELIYRFNKKAFSNFII